MKQIRVGQVIVDRCHGCAGLWLDALEKDKLLADRGSVAKADHPPEGRLSVSRPSLKCPRDKSDLICMTDPVQRHVLFESCTVCGGVFLDAGELTDLSEHTLRERIFGR